jgi:putative ABC transport system ATP-binding protein
MDVLLGTALEIVEPTSRYMIEIQDLQFSYGDSGFRLHVPRLTIGRGEHVSMIGPSGSGKTTLLNVIAGIISPTCGQVATCATQLGDLSDVQLRDFRIQKVGFVFQDFELIEYLNVRDNILLPCRISRSLALTDDVRQRAAALAEAVGITNKLSRYVNQLSQGERQRVAICRALLMRPGVILADEPTGNLDPDTAVQVIDTLVDAADEAGATLLVVTHDHSLLQRFQRVIDIGEFHADDAARAEQPGAEDGQP